MNQHINIDFDCASNHVSQVCLDRFVMAQFTDCLKISNFAPQAQQTFPHVMLARCECAKINNYWEVRGLSGTCPYTL